VLDGGGLEIEGSSDTRLTNDNFSGNTANGRGGGISLLIVGFLLVVRGLF
jgi:hypothetical protein